MHKGSRFVERTIEDLQNVSSSIQEGVTSYINTECPPEGLTINVCGKEGKIILYISRTTTTPNSAIYDAIIEVEKDKCDDTYVECMSEEESRRRKRQSASPDRIYIGIEGVEETNEYELNANTGDTSTPKGIILVHAMNNKYKQSFPYILCTVKLQCQQSILLEPQSVKVTCTSERELISILCSINNGPFQNCKLERVLPPVSYLPFTCLQMCRHLALGD